MRKGKERKERGGGGVERREVKEKHNKFLVLESRCSDLLCDIK
jgi:hypothetical protein